MTFWKKLFEAIHGQDFPNFGNIHFENFAKISERWFCWLAENQIVENPFIGKYKSLAQTQLAQKSQCPVREVSDIKRKLNHNFVKLFPGEAAETSGHVKQSRILDYLQKFVNPIQEKTLLSMKWLAGKEASPDGGRKKRAQNWVYRKKFNCRNFTKSETCLTVFCKKPRCRSRLKLVRTTIVMWQNSNTGQ